MRQQEGTVCNQLAKRLCMIVLVVLFTAALCAGQAHLPQLQNPISWGWNAAPDNEASVSGIGQNGTNAAPGDLAGMQNGSRSQDQAQANPASQGSSEPSSDNGASPTSNTLPADESSSNTPDSASLQTDPNAPADTSNSNSSSSDSSSSNSSSSLWQSVRSPFQVESQGLKIGPIYLTSLSDSFFYAVNTSAGNPTQSYYGNSITGNLIYNKEFSNGVLAVQGREQLSTSELTPYYNQSISASYTDQLTARWSLSAASQFTYFQNSILANPQYLLVPTSGGPVLQTLFVLQRGSSAYEANSLGLSYELSGRTHITFSPILGLTFQEAQTGWVSSQQYGGSVNVSHDFTDNFSAGGFYTLSHTVASQNTGTPGWNTQNLGANFQYRFHDTWSIAGSLAASGQLVGQIWELTPTGNFTLRKSFSDSSIISAAYTRTEASAVFVSAGYYDQADIGYSRKFGDKLRLAFNAGEYHTTVLAYRQDGLHAGVSTGYRLSPHLSIDGGYTYAHQNGAGGFELYSLVGNVNSFSVGITWSFGARSGY